MWLEHACWSSTLIACPIILNFHMLLPSSMSFWGDYSLTTLWFMFLLWWFCIGFVIIRIVSTLFSSLILKRSMQTSLEVIGLYLCPLLTLLILKRFVWRFWRLTVLQIDIPFWVCLYFIMGKCLLSIFGYINCVNP